MHSVYLSQNNESSLECNIFQEIKDHLIGTIQIEMSRNFIAIIVINFEMKSLSHFMISLPKILTFSLQYDSI
jgi:hypothetical protein